MSNSRASAGPRLDRACGVARRPGAAPLKRVVPTRSRGLRSGCSSTCVCGSRFFACTLNRLGPETAQAVQIQRAAVAADLCALAAIDESEGVSARAARIGPHVTLFPGHRNRSRELRRCLLAGRIARQISIRHRNAGRVDRSWIAIRSGGFLALAVVALGGGGCASSNDLGFDTVESLDPTFRGTGHVAERTDSGIRIQLEQLSGRIVCAWRAHCVQRSRRRSKRESGGER